jgi:hypothetical protein
MNTSTESPLVQRLRGYVAAAEAMEAGKKWQIYDTSLEKWITPVSQTEARLLEWIRRDVQMRPAPEPITRAWTLDTAPVDQVVFVRHKNGTTFRLVTEWLHEQAHIAGCGYIDYITLRADWLRADGSACGTVEGGNQ